MHMPKPTTKKPAKPRPYATRHNDKPRVNGSYKIDAGVKKRAEAYANRYGYSLNNLIETALAAFIDNNGIVTQVPAEGGVKLYIAK